jgi:phosphoribosylamine-glycine ligase
VLTVSALGDVLEDARGLAYEAASRIEFEGKTFRRDIAEGIHKGSGS